MFTVTEPLVRKLLATVDAGLVSGVGIPEPGKMCVQEATSYALGEPHSDEPSCVDPIVVRLATITLNNAAWSSEQARAKGMRRVAIAQLGSRDMIDTMKFVQLFVEYIIREVVPMALRVAAKINPSTAHTLEERAVQCERDGDEAAARAATRAASDTARAAMAAARAASNAAIDAARAASRASRAASDAARAASDASDAAMATSYAAMATSDAASYASDAARAAGEASNAPLSLCATLMVRALQECQSPGCDWLWLVDEAVGEVQR